MGQREMVLLVNKKEKGQSLVELAIALPFLIVLLVAVIDLGWMFFTLISVRESVQEAATFATVCPTNEAAIRNRLRESSSDPFDLDSVPDGQITICVVDPATGNCGGPIEIGNQIRVTVTYNHNILTPVLGTIIGSQQYPITASASGTILQKTCPAGL